METTTENQQALAAIDRGLSRIEPSLWVVNRQRSLKAEAHNMRTGINIAKTTSISGAVVAGGVGLRFGASGVGIVGGGLGLLAYGAVMVADLLDTGRFAPLPFIRTGVADKLEQLGNAEAREFAAQVERLRIEQGGARFEADEELYSNLPEELCNEALMLAKHAGLIISLLGQLPTEQRDLAYVQLCAMYGNFGDSLTGLSLARLKDSIEGRIRGNYTVMRPAEIHEYQPPVYELANAGDRSFGDLPPAHDAVGSTTRLTAIDVASSSVPAATVKILSAYQLITASPYRSRLFLGGQRTGKSYLAFQCASAAKAKGTEIYYVNLAAWGTEDDGYSAIANMSTTANLQSLTAEQAVETVKDALKTLTAFYLSPKPAILIFEEWCECGSKNHEHAAALEPLSIKAASIVEQLANTGQKRQKAIYATAPLFVAGGLAQTAKAAKSMELVLVAIAPGRSVDWNGQAIVWSPAVYAQAQANFYGLSEPTGELNGDRIVFCDGQWVEVGEFPATPAKSAKASPAPVAAEPPASFAAA
jgi:hypothetical protein